MGKKNPKVDEYIEASNDFARPILNHIRAVVHEACPDVKETIKWNAPVFEHKGIMANMAAFKEHCAFRFWKASLIFDDASDSPMGPFSHIKSLDDLPPKETLIGYIQKAMELNEKGIRPPKISKKKAELDTPKDFEDALREVPGALKAFESMPPSHRREYIEWILEAKRDDTRKRRIKKAVDQISDGKSLNWKYM